MRHVADVITDCATVCFYDPYALPIDFIEQWYADVQGYFDRVSRQGLLWFTTSNADGLYRTEFYVGEDPPPAALLDAVPLPWMPKLMIPSGIVCVASPEGIFGANDLDDLPTRERLPTDRFEPGCVFCVEPGDYDVISWAFDRSDETRYDPSVPSTQYGPDFVVQLKRFAPTPLPVPAGRCRNLAEGGFYAPCIFPEN